MPQHWIQLTEEEWIQWQAVIACARSLRVNSKAGSYKGAISDGEAGTALRGDLNALVLASSKVREVEDD